MKSCDTYGDLIMTLFAGKLTPAASVDVHVNKHNTPSLYACSMSCLSSVVSPEWWYAIPNWIVCCKTGHTLFEFSAFNSLKSFSLRSCLCCINSCGRLLAKSEATFSQFFFVEQKMRHDSAGMTSLTFKLKWKND